MKKTHRLVAAACIVSAISFSGAVVAEPLAFSDEHAFHEALPAPPHVLNFDAMTPGTTIVDAATAEGITFKYDFEGLAMKVAHLYATTSAPNFLGTADGGMFHDGDNFELSFPPGSAIGLYFISADPLVDGDIKVFAGGTTASLSTREVQATLADGSRVYFLGVVDADAPITRARVEALAGGFFLYNVDDIVTAPVRPPSVASRDGGGVADPL